MKYPDNGNSKPSGNNFQAQSFLDLVREVFPSATPVLSQPKPDRGRGLRSKQGVGSYPRVNSTLSSEFSEKAQKRYEERGEVWKWLDTNGYCRYAHALSSCLGTALEFGCGKHPFFRGDFCSSPLCPICSKKNSYAHQRRKAHFHEKLGWADTLGKAVFTFPPELQYLEIGEMFKLVADFLLNHFTRYFVRGIEGGESVFHATGRRLTRHPHFEVLFGIEDDPEGVIRRKTRHQKKKIDDHRIGRFSRHWSAYLKRVYSVRSEPVERIQVGVVVSKGNKLVSTKARRWKVRYWIPLLDLPKNVQVHYEYDDTPGKVGHAIKYASRLAFLNPKQFLTLDDEMKKWLANLRGKRLIRGFGKLSDRNWRSYVASKPKPEPESKTIGEKVFKMLEGFRCPVDGEELHFVRRVSWDRKGRDGYVECSGIGRSGWWCSVEVFRQIEERYFNDS